MGSTSDDRRHIDGKFDFVNEFDRHRCSSFCIFCWVIRNSDKVNNRRSEVTTKDVVVSERECDYRPEVSENESNMLLVLLCVMMKLIEVSGQFINRHPILNYDNKLKIQDVKKRVRRKRRFKKGKNEFTVLIIKLFKIDYVA